MVDIPLPSQCFTYNVWIPIRWMPWDDRGTTPCAMPCPAAVEVAAGANAPAILVLAAAPGTVFRKRPPLHHFLGVKRITYFGEQATCWYTWFGQTSTVGNRWQRLFFLFFPSVHWKELSWGGDRCDKSTEAWCFLEWHCCQTNIGWIVSNADKIWHLLLDTFIRD